MSPKKHTALLFIVSAFVLLVVGALFLAQFVSTNVTAQNLIADAGYLGIVIIAIIAGLNAIVPIPAATFTPLFTVAGLSLPLIIASLVIGTVIADTIGFSFGRWSRTSVAEHYPKTHDFFTSLVKTRQWLILPMVTLYASFVPFPNEAILIPLAIAGVSFYTILPALIIGNIIHQTTLALGFSSLFSWLF